MYLKIKPSKLRLPAWGIWLLVSILGIILSLTILRLVYLEPWLQKKLTDTIYKKSGGIYQVKMAGLNTSLLGGSLTLDSVALLPNYQLWEKKKEQKQDSLPAILVAFKTTQIKIDGLNYFKILQNKPLNLTEIRLQKPLIMVTQMQPETDSRPIYSKLKGSLKSLRIQTFTTDQANIIYKKYRAKSNLLELNQLQLAIKDICLDSLSYHDPERFYYTTQVTTNIGKADMLLPEGFYRLKAGAIAINTQAKTGSIKAAKLVPLYSSAGLARRLGRAIPRLQIQVPEILVSNINYPQFSRSSSINMGLLTFKNPQLYAYMDSKNFPQKGKKPLLHELIQGYKKSLSIKKVEIKNMHLRYEELAPKASRKGYLTLANMNVSLANITNDKKQMTDKTPAVIKGSGLIMGKAWLTTTIRINLLNANGYHTVQGTLGEAKPEIINPIIEPAYYVRVRSGSIRKGNFNMILNNNRATGTMRLEYKNFKVDLLSKDKETEDKDAEPDKNEKKKKQSFGRKILTIFANKVVLNTHNTPENDGPLGIAGFKTGEINTRRRVNRSVFTYWIDGLASGVRSTLGLKSQIPEN